MIPITHPFRKVREKDGAPGGLLSEPVTLSSSEYDSYGMLK